MRLNREIGPGFLWDITVLEEPLAQCVHMTIRAAILSLDFPPGANLRKALTCECLGVSRAPVADAITRLSADGLVDLVPQSGTRVAYFSMTAIRESAFLREALELAAVKKVARNLTEDQRRMLSRNMRPQELLIEDEDVSGFYEADEEFHRLLMEFTGYARLQTVSQSISLQVSRARMFLLPTPGRIVETLDEHRSVYEVICNRDKSAARKAMQVHLGQLMLRFEKLALNRPELFNQSPTPEVTTHDNNANNQFERPLRALRSAYQNGVWWRAAWKSLPQSQRPRCSGRAASRI